MPEVHISSHDNNIEKDLRNFKRRVDKAGLPASVRKNMCHIKPTALRKRQAAAAKKRWEKKLQKEKESMTRMLRSKAHMKLKKASPLVSKIKAENAMEEDSSSK
jgi:small subunit ribosomal protein S21